MRRFDDEIPQGGWTVDIPTLLQMDEIAPDIFRNRHNQRNVFRSLFGGQMIGQALVAADRTVPARIIHSLHAYFIRAGDVELPIDFQVERIRDGGRFSTRRVVAQQNDEILFTMECSYRTPIAGFSHYRPTAIEFVPERAIDIKDLAGIRASDGRVYAGLSKGHYPIDARISGLEAFLEVTDEAKRHYWLRAPGAEVIDDPAAHRQILAFLSDYMFAGVPLSRHTVALPDTHLFVASLDHCIWFHRDVRCDDWLLFETEGPNAENGVNLARGFIYDRAGHLIASIVQEALQIPITPDQGA